MKPIASSPLVLGKTRQEGLTRSASTSPKKVTHDGSSRVEMNIQPDRGGISVLQGSTSHVPPRQVSLIVSREETHAPLPDSSPRRASTRAMPSGASSFFSGHSSSGFDSGSKRGFRNDHYEQQTNVDNHAHYEWR